MERLVQHIAEVLAESGDLIVIGPMGCSVFLPRDVVASEVAYRPLSRFLIAAAGATCGLRDLSLVIAGSGLTAPLAWWAAKRNGATFVVYLHGLDVIAPSVIYQRCWLPFIRRAGLVLVNSRNTRRLAIERGVPAGVIHILHPGTDLPAPDASAGRAFRTSHGLCDRPLLLAVGRFTPRKGLAEFILNALPDILASEPEAVLLVIGADAMDAARPAADSEHARILRSAEQAGVSTAVRFLPPCDDDILSAAYRAADVHVFPVLDLPGDVEGFGMVAIEAAAHGLATVAFDVGGVADAVLEDVTGNLVTAGDYPAFSLRVRKVLAGRNQPGRQDRCAAAASSFGWDRFGTQLQLALHRLARE
jgi:phosphatidylinositol alpha-1,6-mannosyltransferase